MNFPRVRLSDLFRNWLVGACLTLTAIGNSCALFLPWQLSAAVVQAIQASEEEMRLFSNAAPAPSFWVFVFPHWESGVIL
jgi:hypothetical protein